MDNLDEVPMDLEIKTSPKPRQILSENIFNQQIQTSSLYKTNPHKLTTIVTNAETPKTAPESCKYAFPPSMGSTCNKENRHQATDHCYLRPWSLRPEMPFLRPAKTLYIQKESSSKRRRFSNPFVSTASFCISNTDEEDEVDVETVTEEVPAVTLDMERGKEVMEECEKVAGAGRNEQKDENWEEKLSKDKWTSSQHRLFNQMMNILDNFHLAQLANTDIQNEPLLRRLTIKKSVQRMRRLMATVSWDTKLTQWLHQLLIDNLNQNYLSAYLNILRGLKHKLPTFVDKMIFGSHSIMRTGPLSSENLFNLLKRPFWDPIPVNPNKDKSRKLAGNPIIVLIPPAPVTSSSPHSRYHKLTNLLSSIAFTITVPNLTSANSRLSTMHCLDQMYATMRIKLQEVRATYPDRQVILVGFSSGGSLALQLAQTEQVMCVICLGFSLMTAEGRRGQPEDNLLELQVPVLFIIGQCANRAVKEDVEDLRERMRIETGLIVVGGADDNLCVGKRKLKSECLTQSIVDRAIMDEVSDFIGGLISSPFPPQIRQSPTAFLSEKKTKAERKRYGSSISNFDGDLPSSASPRITRPVGRPPGSKTKSRLEAKWAQQIAQAKMQAYNLNRSILPPGGSSTLSTLLQGGIKTIPPTPTSKSNNNSSIKILENIQINPGHIGSKMSSKVATPATIDLSKTGMYNCMTTGKGMSNSPMLMPISGNVNKPVTSSMTCPSFPATYLPHKGSKLITSKKQLIGNRPLPKQPKKTHSIHFSGSSVTETPTNLTTQDILNCPIIFADDNSTLMPEISTSASSTSSIKAVSSSQISVGQHTTEQSTPTCVANKIISSHFHPQTNKFVLVNKQSTTGNYIITPALKKPISAVASADKTPKFTKIILSKRTDELMLSSGKKLHNFDIPFKRVEAANYSFAEPSTSFNTTNNFDKKSSCVTGKIFEYNMEDFANIDLESDLVTTVPKQIINLETGEEDDDDSDKDPDYVPPK